MMRPKAAARREQPCPHCNGTGERLDGDSDEEGEPRVITRACGKCNGRGFILGLLMLVCVLGGSLALPSQGATVTGLLSTASSNPYATNVLFLPWSTPLVSGNLLVGSAGTNVLADAGGAFSVTLKAGDYRVNVGELRRDTFFISVPTNIATYNITTLITNSLTYTFQENPSYLSSASASASFVAKAGDTMTGALQWNTTNALGLLVNVLTTVQRDALTPVNGAIIYNSAAAAFQKYEAGAWGTLGGGGSGLTTNANQFAANPTLTIVASAKVTNMLNRGLFDALITEGGRLMVSESTPTGQIIESAYDASKLDFLDATSSIQTQINAKTGTQMVAAAVGTITATNQARFLPQHFKGSDTTNQFDFTLATHKAWTNQLTTNIVCQLTNVTQGCSISTVFYGANGAAIASNYTVKLTAPAGAGIFWLGGLGTNGSFDFAVPSNQVVFVSLFADRSTNVYAQWNTNLVNVP